MTTREMVGRTAIVTGAGRGIGAGICERLSQDGWQIVAGDIDGAAVTAVAQRCAGIAIVCDVGTAEGVDSLVDAARKHYGRVDAIISNAGISRNGPLTHATLEDWNRVLAVNLTSAFLLAKQAEPDLKQVKGQIVLIASTRAHMSEANTLAYSASKGGLVALTHALAMTLAPDVRVNCISPGWIDTGKLGALRSVDHAQHPVGRIGTPKDVAGTVAFLLSSDAAFMTGAELVLDGGMTRKMIYV
jgi:NAD(P)-dependent dehydrogenase (short-subunit alcohol dehydrogenase family)